MNDGKILLTSKQASESLGICERTLYGLAKSGELPVVKIGRAVRYPVSELQKWVEKKCFENSQNGA